VLTELTARGQVHRILIVSPADPFLEQWKVEMSERFGLRMEVIDRAKLEEIRRSTELGSSPFDHIPLGLVSLQSVNGAATRLCPGGALDNSPAIYRWERSSSMSFQSRRDG
jgi:SNF2 family DNA or RNA helicase